MWDDEYDFAVPGKAHQIGLPVSGLGALLDVGRALGNGRAVLDVLNGTDAAPAQAAAAVFTHRQEAMPVILLGRAMIDVTID